MARNATQTDTSVPYFDKKQYVVGDQTPPGQHFHGEEIRPRKDVHLRPNELFPGRGTTPLRRWRDIVPSQNVPDRLVRDFMAQVGQGADDAIVAPTTVFAR